MNATTPATPTRTTPRPRLEIRWRSRDARDRAAGRLVAEWVVVEQEQEQPVAA